MNHVLYMCDKENGFTHNFDSFHSIIPFKIALIDLYNICYVFHIKQFGNHISNSHKHGYAQFDTRCIIVDYSTF